MQKIIGFHVLYNLRKDCSFKNLRTDWKKNDRPVVLWIDFLVLFVKRDCLGCFPYGWKDWLGDGEVNHVGDDGDHLFTKTKGSPTSLSKFARSNLTFVTKKLFIILPRSFGLEKIFP